MTDGGRAVSANYAWSCRMPVHERFGDASLHRRHVGRGQRSGDMERVDRGASGVDLDGMPAPGTDRALELCALDEALDALARMDARRAKVIELRFFGGPDC